MIINAWMTGTIIEWAEDGSGDYTEENGWVDSGWNIHDVFPSRNDVRPVATWNSFSEYDVECYPTPDAFIRATLRSELGTWEDGGNGCYYGTDEYMSDQSLRDGKTYTYTLHFTSKRYDSVKGWTEDEVTLND